MKRSNPVPKSLFRLSPVAAGATVLVISMGAHAQTTGPSTQPAATSGDTQTITVTGIRRGIENAINVKKNQDSIVEAVSAEDIGKLPDSSIAESIARLPGLTAQRVNGRAKEISIRGLSGQFANTLLNGREQTSTGNNRSVEFDQYPSELLSAVVVYKTPDAALMGQGIAGTVDLQTVRPLSFGQRTVAINVRGEQNGKGTPFEGSGQPLQPGLHRPVRRSHRGCGARLCAPEAGPPGVPQRDLRHDDSWLSESGHQRERQTRPAADALPCRELAGRLESGLQVLRRRHQGDARRRDGRAGVQAEQAAVQRGRCFLLQVRQGHHQARAWRSRSATPGRVAVRPWASRHRR